MLKIPLSVSTLENDEIDQAVEVLKSTYLTMGQHCEAFEEKFAQKMGVKHAVFVNSGSSANLMAFSCLTNPLLADKNGRPRLQPGDEVLVPAVTWATTIWPIVQVGCVPVLVDSDPRTLQMDVDALEEAMSDKVKAICPVHVMGNAVEMDALMAFAEKHGLWVMEDTCEALGTRYKDRAVGTIGDIGTYSFFFSHHITTGEGGMVVTNDDDTAEILRCLRAHGWTRNLKNREAVEKQYPDIDPRFLFINLGYNLRPGEINAVLGLRQLDRLDGFNQNRKDNAEYWVEQLKDLGDQIRPMQIGVGVDATWFGFPVLYKSKEALAHAKSFLQENGVETRPIICGNMARQPAMKLVDHRVAGELKGANEVMDQGMYWGNPPVLDDEIREGLAPLVKKMFM